MRRPADGLSCLDLLLSSVSWGDLQKISCKENMELCPLPGRAPEFLHDDEKLDVLWHNISTGETLTKVFFWKLTTFAQMKLEKRQNVVGLMRLQSERL